MINHDDNIDINSNHCYNLHPNVNWMYFFIFLQRASYYGLTPLLPGILISNNHTALSVVDAGLVIKAAYVFTGIGSIIMSILADKYIGIRKSMIGGALSQFIGYILLLIYGFVQSDYIIYITVIFVIPFGFGVLATLDTVFCSRQFHLTRHVVELKHFYYRSFQVINMGAVCGILISILLFTYHQVDYEADYNIQFLVYAIFMAMCVFILIFYTQTYLDNPPLIAQNIGIHENVYKKTALIAMFYSISTTPMMIIFSLALDYFIFQGFEMAPFYMIDATYMFLAEPFFIIILSPIVKKIELSHINMFIIGNIFSFMSVIYMACINMILKSTWSINNHENLSILTQLPAYFFMSMSMLFSVPTSKHMGYIYSPEYMKSIIASLHQIFTTCVPFVISMVVSYLFSTWSSDSNGCSSRKACDTLWDYKQVHFEYLYLVLSIIPFVSLCACQILKPYYTKLQQL
jgi:dipeptide/tripeptide permease